MRKQFAGLRMGGLNKDIEAIPGAILSLSFILLLVPMVSSCESHASRYSEKYTSETAANSGGWISRMMTQENVTIPEQTAVAVRMTEAPDAEGFPKQTSWELARTVRFDTDWQGKNSDPQRETEVWLLWTRATLYLRFRAKYRDITVFPDSEASGRRDQLWDRDVAEAFLQPDTSRPNRYKEFEVSPNGFWIDLDIAPGEKHDLKSGLRRRVMLDETTKTWVAELALPMKCLVEEFDPAAEWRVNFYRVEGAREPRFYSAWRPTRTSVPNFHVPEAFGKLIFVSSPPSQK